MPTAAPSTAATTGFGHATSGQAARGFPLTPRPIRSPGGVPARAARSVPAQNAPPAPVTITARASPSPPARSTASWKSASTSQSMALRFSGRSMVIVATWPSTS
jgi:hypothetical protein